MRVLCIAALLVVSNSLASLCVAAQNAGRSGGSGSPQSRSSRTASSNNQHRIGPGRFISHNSNRISPSSGSRDSGGGHTASSPRHEGTILEQSAASPSPSPSPAHDAAGRSSLQKLAKGALSPLLKPVRTGDNAKGSRQPSSTSNSSAKQASRLPPTPVTELQHSASNTSKDSPESSSRQTQPSHQASPSSPKRNQMPSLSDRPNALASLSNAGLRKLGLILESADQARRQRDSAESPGLQNANRPSDGHDAASNFSAGKRISSAGDTSRTGNRLGKGSLSKDNAGSPRDHTEGSKSAKNNDAARAPSILPSILPPILGKHQPKGRSRDVPKLRTPLPSIFQADKAAPFMVSPPARTGNKFAKGSKGDSRSSTNKGDHSGHRSQPSAKDNHSKTSVRIDKNSNSGESNVTPVPIVLSNDGHVKPDISDSGTGHDRRRSRRVIENTRAAQRAGASAAWLPHTVILPAEAMWGRAETDEQWRNHIDAHTPAPTTLTSTLAPAPSRPVAHPHPALKDLPVEILPADDGLSEPSKPQASSLPSQSTTSTAPLDQDEFRPEASQVDLRLRLPYASLVEDSTLVAQLFGFFPSELASAMEIPTERIRVAAVRPDVKQSFDEDGNVASLVRVELASNSGVSGPAGRDAEVARLRELMQNPDSRLWRGRSKSSSAKNATAAANDGPGAFTRLLDADFLQSVVDPSLSTPIVSIGPQDASYTYIITIVAGIGCLVLYGTVTGGILVYVRRHRRLRLQLDRARQQHGSRSESSLNCRKHAEPAWLHKNQRSNPLRAI